MTFIITTSVINLTELICRSCTTVARLRRHQHRDPGNFLKLIFNVQRKGFTLYMYFNPRHMNRFL